ncbi:MULTISPECIES: nuclear transport factor 2 family protein [Actinosynnema]|uniref:nuclear transport factor 2 family protein n=1 Tax=Actinosynnema TaxID=40566 RepID=UPI0020A2B949|nr:nuclear transport factor 2 family protein [Actinosynnema pretiosum]MCP2096388.1 SnoaL-like domain-containing protein [Actinosynnema pretiosum]
MNRDEITEFSALISRFFRAMDAREFPVGWAGEHFTTDARLSSPIGSAEGIEEVAAHVAESVRRFARTQHTSSDVLVESADPVVLTWNALMTHVHAESTLLARGPGANPVFQVGGLWRAELRSTPDGPRISDLSHEAIWITGQPPALPEGVRPVVAGSR